MAKTAYDLFRELRQKDEGIAYHERETRRLRDERMTLFPDLKLAFNAADGRPVTFDGKLYRATWQREVLVDVVATEVTTPFDLEMPEPAEDPEDDEELDLRFGGGPPGPEIEGSKEPEMSYTIESIHLGPWAFEVEKAGEPAPDRIERPAGEDPTFRFEQGRGDGS